MNKKTSGLSRLLKETITTYPVRSLVVVILILISAFANVYGSMFMRTLIDDYIQPLLR